MSDVDLSKIPTGPDGQPDRAAVIEVLSRYVDDLKKQLDYQVRIFNDLTSEKGELETRHAAVLWALSQLSTRDARAFARLDARREIHQRVFLYRLGLVAAIAVAVPLGLALLSFAWRFGLWSITQ